MTGPGNVESDGIIVPSAVETGVHDVREREVPDSSNSSMAVSND
jgi:hypothetical protein